MKDDMKELKDSMLKKLFSIGVLYHELTGKTLYLGGGIIRDVIYNSIYKSKDLYIYDLDIYGIDLDYKIINKIINNLDLSVLSDNNNTGYIYNTTRYISNKYEYIYNNINIIYNIINIISSNIPKDRLKTFESRVSKNNLTKYYLNLDIFQVFYNTDVSTSLALIPLRDDYFDTLYVSHSFFPSLTEKIIHCTETTTQWYKEKVIERLGKGFKTKTHQNTIFMLDHMLDIRTENSFKHFFTPLMEDQNIYAPDLREFDFILKTTGWRSIL